jgi:hypothetical protein
MRRECSALACKVGAKRAARHLLRDTSIRVCEERLRGRLFNSSVGFNPRSPAAPTPPRPSPAPSMPSPRTPLPPAAPAPSRRSARKAAGRVELVDGHGDGRAARVHVDLLDLVLADLLRVWGASAAGTWQGICEERQRRGVGEARGAKLTLTFICLPDCSGPRGRGAGRGEG